MSSGIPLPRVLRLKSFRHYYRTDAPHIGYRLEYADFGSKQKGDVVIALVLGVETKDGEPLDVEKTLNSAGWFFEPDIKKVRKKLNERSTTGQDKRTRPNPTL